MDAAVVEPFEARVEPAADLYHGAFRMVAEKIRDQHVEHGAPQSTRENPPPLPEPCEIPIDGVDHFNGPGIVQDRAFSAALDRSGI